MVVGALLVLTNASIGYRRRALISCIDLSIERGEVVFLSGPNGSGKSTLAKSLLGVIPLVYGNRRCTYERVAYVPQSSGFEVQYPVTVTDLISQGMQGHYTLRAGVARRAAEHAGPIQSMLAELKLESCARSLLREVSGGQLQRALIGRALVGNPDFLLLDEPFSNLDRSGRGEVAAILKKYAAPGRTICVIDHGDAIERSFYTRSLEIDNGHLVDAAA